LLQSSRGLGCARTSRFAPTDGRKPDRRGQSPASSEDVDGGNMLEVTSASAATALGLERSLS
jgi:hypothetical protein